MVLKSCLPPPKAIRCRIWQYARANLDGANEDVATSIPTISQIPPFLSPSPSSISPAISSLSCTCDQVLKLLRSLKHKTATGVSSRMLKGCATSICEYLSSLFNMSLTFPKDWKQSNITPVFKAGDPKLVSNYRPISIPSKILERIVHNGLMSYLLQYNRLSCHQFGFRPQSFTQEAVLAATNDWHHYLDSNSNVACVFFDLPKALTPCHIL